MNITQEQWKRDQAQHNKEYRMRQMGLVPGTAYGEQEYRRRLRDEIMNLGRMAHRP